MQDERDNPRSGSQVLPLVIAAFAGATLAIACDRPADISVREGGAPANTARVQQPGIPASAEAPQSTPRTPMPPPEALTDTVITARIKTAMLGDPMMDGADVSVSTNEGVVTLVGRVKSFEQMGIASAHAQRQDGVMRVDNELSPTPQ